MVSVIMPVYNGEKYLDISIRSVLNQSLSDFELIIIDDGSTDNSHNIITSYTDNRIKCISQKNMGVSVARNQGLDVSRGCYITFLDSDDMLPPNSLEMRVLFLQNNPEYNLVDGKISLRDKDMENEIRLYSPDYRGNLLHELLNLNDKVFFNVCYLFKRELTREIRFEPDMSHAEDLNYYIQMSAAYQVQYASIQDEIYFYRKGHESAMSNISSLENGYSQLVQSVGKLSGIPFWKLFIFKAKIAKIMTLCWLKQRKFIRALLSPLYIYGMIGKK